MKIDFTSYAGQVVRDNPAVGVAGLMPCVPVVMTGGELWRLIEDAFQHGVVHHSRVMTELAEMAIRDAEKQAAAEADTGPKSLQQHFDEVFGPRKAG